MALYARHRVQYLTLAWVNGIFGFILLGEALFSDTIATFPPGILNPVVLLAFLAGIFLQSIYPLSIPMPGFLQWERMWGYALPIIILYGIYALTLPYNHGIVFLMSWGEVMDHLLSVDVMCRLAAVGLSLYYIINILLCKEHKIKFILKKTGIAPRLSVTSRYQSLSYFFIIDFSAFSADFSLCLYLDAKSALPC